MKCVSHQTGHSLAHTSFNVSFTNAHELFGGTKQETMTIASSHCPTIPFLPSPLLAHTHTYNTHTNMCTCVHYLYVYVYPIWVSTWQRGIVKLFLIRPINVMITQFNWPFSWYNILFHINVRTAVVPKNTHTNEQGTTKKVHVYTFYGRIMFFFEKKKKVRQ